MGWALLGGSSGLSEAPSCIWGQLCDLGALLPGVSRPSAGARGAWPRACLYPAGPGSVSGFAGEQRPVEASAQTGCPGTSLPANLPVQMCRRPAPSRGPETGFRSCWKELLSRCKGAWIPGGTGGGNVAIDTGSVPTVPSVSPWDRHASNPAVIVGGREPEAVSAKPGEGHCFDSP